VSRPYRPAQLQFEVTKAELWSWGRPNNGLQLGIALDPSYGGKNVFGIDDEVRVVVQARNISNWVDDTVNFSYVEYPSTFFGVRPQVVDAAGKPAPVSMGPLNVFKHIAREKSLWHHARFSTWEQPALS
jgi:hypothetical protein